MAFTRNNIPHHIVGLPIETICFSAQRKYPLGSKKWEREAKELLETVLEGDKACLSRANASASIPDKWLYPTV